MNAFQTKTDELRAVIYGELTPLIKSDYVLLNCPYHSNIGDMLIWRGEQAFLENIPYRCLNQSSLQTFRRNLKITSAHTILLHGGGNFGDLWRIQQDFRLEIIARYPANRIIIFPQTVFYGDRSLMERDAEEFAKHPDITICARDAVSYKILKENFRNNILLVPDMAFCIDTDELNRWKLPEEDKVLYVRRLDRELADDGVVPEREFPGAVVADWPTFERKKYRLRLLKILINVVWIAKKYKATVWFANLLARVTDRYADKSVLPYMVKTGVRFISPFKMIYTTRLHVAILSVLLRKKCRFIDNSYGKNSSYYDTWLKGMEGVSMFMRD